jgi:hypothetical protein
MNFLFYTGIALLPFENFFFAPSTGWAAIAPLAFFLYFIVNIRYIGNFIYKYKKIWFILIWSFIITFFNFLNIEYRQASAARFFDSFIQLGLGIATLFSFDIFFTFKISKKKIKTVEKILLVTYTISMVTGIVQFIGIKYHIGFIMNLREFLSARNYSLRPQFTFTEPSFIGMHLFGILLPFYVYDKNKKIRNLIIIYASLAILMNSGVRIVLDSIVVIGVIMLYKIDFKKLKNIVLILIVGIIGFISVYTVYNNNERIRNIVTNGVYADGSFSSRWFRVNASLKGYKNDPLHALIGYGIGQEVLPLKKGYSEAYSEYKNDYMGEVNGLATAEKKQLESVSFCMYIRIISEMGFVVFLIIARSLFLTYKTLNQKDWKIVFLVMLYLYIQFESYAFYSLWILMVLISTSFAKNHNHFFHYVEEVHENNSTLFNRI